MFFLASDKISLVVETAGCLLSRRQISNGSNCGQVPLEKIKGPSCLLGSCWKRLKWQTRPSKATSSHQKTHGRLWRVHVQIGYKLESIRATTAGVDFSTYSTDHREFICTWCDTQQKAVQILKLPSYPGVKKLFVCKLKGPNFLAAAWVIGQRRFHCWLFDNEITGQLHWDPLRSRVWSDKTKLHTFLSPVAVISCASYFSKFKESNKHKIC